MGYHVSSCLVYGIKLNINEMDWDYFESLDKMLTAEEHEKFEWMAFLDQSMGHFGGIVLSSREHYTRIQDGHGVEASQYLTRITPLYHHPVFKQFTDIMTRNNLPVKDNCMGWYIGISAG